MDGPGDPDAETFPAQRIRGFADADVHPRRTELRRLADAARVVLDRMPVTAATTEEVTDLADDLEALADRLSALPTTNTYEGFSESANSGDPHAFFDHSPMLGQANPLAPPITLEMHDEHMVGTVTFGVAYEGPPGHVHGGFIAAAFDEVLGSTQSLSGAPGMTGRLTIHYRSPTPLHRELRFTGRIERVDGRKIFTTGQCFDGDTLCSEAEGLFISIDFSRFADMKAAREQE